MSCVPDTPQWWPFPLDWSVSICIGVINIIKETDCRWQQLHEKSSLSFPLHALIKKLSKTIFKMSFELNNALHYTGYVYKTDH